MRFLQQLCKLAVAIFSIVAAPGFVWAAGPCASVEHSGAPFVVCAFDPAKVDIRLFWQDARGDSYGGFDRLAEDVAGQGGRLTFAMNAGMYQPDLSPVGLYVEKGQELKPANRRAGSGNFGMRPNGVFWLANGKAGVTETSKFLTLNLRPSYATQSGPLLLMGGKVHPRIHADGTSEKTRNGVALCDDGLVRFAISDGAVTFYTFATLFRDALKCPDALYLDGSISALYSPALKRNDGWKSIGPIVGVVEGMKR